MTLNAHEWQFDGLVGPTHNYAGLAYGNRASAGSAGSVSNPKAAALQGLDKMAFVRGLGMKQAFLPPQRRPVLKALHQLGFTGNPAKVLEDAHKHAPELLASVYSCACMWTANAATITPGTDSADGRVHFTPANLVTNFHRALEPEFTTKTLRAIFANPQYFMVHDALPATLRFADEGAANHMRVCAAHGEAGLHYYIYGMAGEALVPTRQFPPRQHFEAFSAIARSHGVDAGRTWHLQQHPAAIDQGVFHHDVIGMNTTRLMISHAAAYADAAAFYASIEKVKTYIEEFHFIEIDEKTLPVADAVKSYFFNSQLLATAEGFTLVAPSECDVVPTAKCALETLAGNNGISLNYFTLDVRESMRNGGGPACLRLRIVLNGEQAQAMHPGIILTPEREAALRHWVATHYRDRLHPDDLRDISLMNEAEEAHAALAAITGLAA